MEISVTLRRIVKPESKVAAFADVVLSGPEGGIRLNSFSVFKPNGKKPAWIAPPAIKGEKKFFPLIVLSGEIRSRVETAILSEYQRPVAAQK